ncbi:MAG: molecular chaperone HtpG [Cytophagales bacterium]|nr:molecular chaperone HtpG [Cytophagales bacterium]
MEEKGTISIHTENIFPIIKKFLYADHEVFLRELVANAVDATQKLKQLASMGIYEGETGKIKIAVNEKLKTITISDQGVGMTADEIKKYINQIAFSGATEFVEKYKDKDQQIIGFFGLGFYSAFMVANKVEIITKSYQQDAEAARWSCDGTTTFEITKTVKKEVGTDVVLHVADDSKEFLAKASIQRILDKYCKFLPIEIEFEGKVVNHTTPLWTNSPHALKDEDYLNFYKTLYPFADDPLFWIHLNADYPFNLTGILYFPKIKDDFEQQQNKIQLYSKQVFITDEVKDIVPKFFMLLHGVLDSPDIPLNVSRSFLQADSNVKKINTYIAKKVADKLAELFKKDRKAYEEKWNHIGLFVKYGMISEDKFYEKAKSFALLKNIENQYFTIEEYREKIKANQTDKNKELVMLYATEPAKQDMYIQSCKRYAYDVLKFDSPIDTHFLGFLEQKIEKVSLKRVDAHTVDQLIDKAENQESVLSAEEQKNLQAIYQKAITHKNINWTVGAMPTDELPVTITIPEFMQRMQAMSKTTFRGGELPPQLNVTINANHSLASKMLRTKKEEEQLNIARQAYDLALLSQNMLNGTALTNFIQRSVELVST